ncbi:unnamed protein product [Candida verbasci]|uniref:Anaphase-promoting complex subunit 4 n=1 Tax=Candida verbasci TaxID=1227364 RepID=A0A9W4TXA4_9ASCO|nr:unnamed protein product [Candida verbasci]
MTTIIYNGKLPTLLYDPNCIFTWCPQLNLIFISMNKMSIWCYRINGERIYSINNKSQIKQITFHDKFFCLSGIDNLIKIYNSNDGNLIKILDYKFNNIQFLNWNKTEYKLDNDKLSKFPKIYELETKLDYLVVVDDNEIIFNFNKLWTINLPCEYKITQQVQSDLFDQVYLSEDKLIRINFNIENKPLYIDTILKLCQLSQMMENITSTIKNLETELRTFVIILDRYLSNLNEDIRNVDIFTFLNDLLITNLIPESSKDYWLNQFGERGYKKLVKMSTHLKEYCLNTIFQYLISIMERIIILVGDINGIIKWDKHLIGLDNVDQFLQCCKDLLKFYYKFLWDLRIEFDQFDEFLNWIKTILDTLNDQENVELNYSTSNVLEYINEKLTTPSILKYFKFEDLEFMKNKETDLMVQQHRTFQNQFELILLSIKNHHSSIISINLIQSIKLPKLYTSLKLTKWNNEIIIAYIDSNSNLIITSLRKQLSSIPNVKLFEFDQDSLIALTDKNLLIININSIIPIQLPKINFEPKRLCLNNQFGCLADSKNQNYTIFKFG